MTAGDPLVVGRFSHLVVIYQENHSFDNLYGSWGSVNGGHVEGLADAQQVNTTQVTQDGDAYGCLLQNDVNLSSPSPAAQHLPRQGPWRRGKRIREPAIQH